MNVLMLMMAGKGERFGSKIPKQFTIVNSKPIFLNIVENYAKLPHIDVICLVVNEMWLDKVEGWCSGISKHIIYARGGKNRSESVRNGLRKVESLAKADDVILVHDATHPYLDRDGVERVIESTEKYGAATLASFGYDTVYKIDEFDFVESTIPRQRVINGASPEAFKFSLINSIYATSDDEQLEKMTSAGAMALERGVSLRFIPTDILNLKITFQRDFELYKMLPESYFYR